MTHRIDRIMDGDIENHIAPFLWLHNEDDELIVNELRRIHSCGIGAVCIESRTHQEFCRDDWWSDVQLILDTCKELGMKLWILDDKHFPSGYANGVYEKEENRHLRAAFINSKRIDIAGPIRECSILVDQWFSLPDDKLIGAIALRRTDGGGIFDGTYIDISDTYKDGRCFFDLPEGVWAIVLFIKTQADPASGRRVFGNKLSAEATDLYIEEVYESHYKHFEKYFGNTLLGFFSDEPAFHNAITRPNILVSLGDAFAEHPWHDSLPDELSKYFSGNILSTLARIWYDFSDNSHLEVRERYMDIISRRYSEAFSGRIGKWCEDHGVMFIGHVIEDNCAHRSTGQGTAHYFRALRGQHMSGVDVVLHQLLPGLTEVANTGMVFYREMDNKMNHYVQGKLASSAAHIEPRKKGRAMCEIFGAFGWAEDSQFMKFLIDHYIVRGINYFVPHAFSPKKNDADCPPNFYNTGKNPQFKYFGLLMEYINRMCTLTDGATHIPTCAVIYDAEASWSSGKFTDNKDICKALYDAQLDYDLIPFDSLGDMDENNCINGEHYPIILIPYSDYYNEENLNKLRRLKEHAVCVGEKAIDGFRHVRINELTSLMEQHRDVSASGGNTKYLRYSHYTRDGEDYYLLSNESISTVSTVLSLRGFSGGDYILWDAFENKAVCRSSKDGNIPLALAPNNLLVLIPNAIAQKCAERLTCEMSSAAAPVSTVWKIEICEEESLPNYRLYKTTENLKSITGAKELPTFSGNIRYTAKITLDGTQSGILDLGEVGGTAEVKVNEKHIGVRLFAPYRFDASNAFKAGENTIEITVSNTSVFEQRDKFSRYMAIKPSGLLGPVKI